MPRAQISSKADADLDAIAEHVAEDNEAASDQLIRMLRQKAELYAGQPGMGRRRPELGPDIRSFPHGAYIVFYTPIAGGIRVERVLHGARDIETEFPT